MNQSTRNVMTILRVLHAEHDIDYVSWKERRKALACIEYCVDASIQGQEDCFKKSKKRSITTANISISNINTERKTAKGRKQKWEEKQLYGYFNGQTREITYKNRWTWQRTGIHKRETEFLLIASQNNVIMTSCVHVNIH